MTKYERSIDDKRRLRLFSNVSGSYVVEQTPQTEKRPYNCITVYPSEIIPERQRKSDFWSSLRHDVSVDPQARIQLSRDDIRYIGLEDSKEVFLITLGSKGNTYFRIWNPQDFGQYKKSKETRRKKYLECSVYRPSFTIIERIREAV
ncbi:MAG: hypothetical protein HY831_00920 [Candidatus Aenigmarchaeota archaeon]|nr:hypothetical protein [Candidatus Aenigmarchaeota archaeon]